MVIAVIAIIPLVVHIISTLYTWLLAILTFINNLLLAIFTLMWVLLQVLFTWWQTLFYTCLSPFNTLVTFVWTVIKILFVKFGTFLYKLRLAILGITQFGKFYFRPSPCNPNFGWGSHRTLTITPVLLHNGRRRVHPPNII